LDNARFVSDRVEWLQADGLCSVVEPGEIGADVHRSLRSIFINWFGPVCTFRESVCWVDTYVKTRGKKRKKRKVTYGTLFIIIGCQLSSSLAEDTRPDGWVKEKPPKEEQPEEEPLKQE
jgi:hypothetical protein